MNNVHYITVQETEELLQNIPDPHSSFYYLNFILHLTTSKLSSTLMSTITTGFQ